MGFDNHYEPLGGPVTHVVLRHGKKYYVMDFEWFGLKDKMYGPYRRLDQALGAAEVIRFLKVGK